MTDQPKRGRGRPPKVDQTVKKPKPAKVGINSAHGAPDEMSNQINDLQDTPASPLDLQDADLARETLRQVCRDPAAPAAARAQAARTLAEMAHALGRNAPPPPPSGKPLSSLTRGELEAELAALSRL